MDDSGRLRRRARRIVMATHGSWGDLHPFIALGQALREHGCEVILASHPDYRDKVESTGLDFTPFGVSRETYVTDLRMKPAEIIRRLSGDHSFLIRHLIVPYLESSVRDMLPVIRVCDLVLGSPFAYGAHIAAQIAGKPFTSIALAPTVMMSAWDPPKVRKAPFILDPGSDAARTYNRFVMKAGEQIMAASLSQIRRVYLRHGLHPHIGLGGIVSDHQTLALYSPLLAPSQPDFPPHSEVVGFPYYDAESGTDTHLPDRLAAFLDAGPPPLVFSLGTAVVYGGEAYYRRAIAAAGTLRRRCVILSGPDSPLLSEDFGPEVCVIPYASHSRLFPRAEAIVHHGGIGSTAQALRAGRPQLVTPVFGDQFDNARRIRNIGAGLVLDYDHWRPGSALNSLRQVLYDPAIATAAEQAAIRVTGEDGARRAAEIVAG